MAHLFDYFYGNETEQFAFYRIPKILFKDVLFKDVSTEAKVLYGLMLDRTGLSVKNGWIDEACRVYIIYTIADIMEDLNCADQKAGKLLSELDTVKGVGLIERKRQGLGKPNIIYVKNFFSISRFKNGENHDSGKVNITSPEYPNSPSNENNINNNKNNNTDFSETPIISNQIANKEKVDVMRWIEERKSMELLIKENIDYDIIVNDYPKAWLDEIVALMVDVICSNEEYIRINKQEYPHEVVKSRFLKIDSSHIEYINFALKNNTSNVRNIRAFLITTIYRAPETTDNWYAAKVNYDLKND